MVVVVPFAVVFEDVNSEADNSITDTKLPTYGVAESPFDDVGNDEAGGTKFRVLLVDAKVTAIRGSDSDPPLPLLLLLVELLFVVEAFGNDATANDTFTLGVTKE